MESEIITLINGAINFFKEDLDVIWKVEFKNRPSHVLKKFIEGMRPHDCHCLNLKTLHHELNFATAWSVVILSPCMY